MIGLYLHIPFCTQKCHYCNFVITTERSSFRREAFFGALETESAHYAERFKGVPFDTFYIGGGTPSTLKPRELGRIFALIRRNFMIKPGAEITCEVNPADLDEEKAGCLRRSGVNRVSLGAQSFNERSLKRANRDHGAAEIRRAFGILRRAGFKNISMDLMLSLPDESIEDVAFSLKETLELSPEHVSLYELTIEDKTVFDRDLKKGKLGLPAEGTQLEMLTFARAYLIQNGYTHYELLSYARPGFESKHNLIYWANEPYLGLGPGAFSYFDGRRFRNSAHVDEYLAKIAKGDWTAIEEETLTAEKQEIESFLLALRLTRGADLSSLPQARRQLAKTVESLEAKGLLEVNDRVRLTAKGQLFAETVFTELSG